MGRGKAFGPVRGSGPVISTHGKLQKEEAQSGRWQEGRPLEVEKTFTSV